MNRLHELKERAEIAMQDFRRSVRNATSLKYEELEERETVHDNVRIVEADCESFSYTLAKEKQQIVVILRGEWEILHGGVKKSFNVADVFRVPMDSPFSTVLHAKEPGSKLVYVQFR